MHAQSPGSHVATLLAVGLLGVAPLPSVAVAADEPPDAAAGERVIRRLGGNTRFSAPIPDVRALQAMADRQRDDLAAVLGQAGLGAISSQVIDVLISGAVTETIVLPGTRLEWMALRRGAGPT